MNKAIKIRMLVVTIWGREVHLETLEISFLDFLVELLILGPCKVKSKKSFSSMVSKLINIQWIRTGY